MPASPLPANSPSIAPSTEALRYANKLLSALKIPVPTLSLDSDITPEQRWRNCGLAELTGGSDQFVTNCPVPIACCADGVLAAFEQISGRTLQTEHRGADLLTVRATMTGLTRRGRTSPGGSCRILATTDGHIALNLARDSDWQLLHAWLQRPVTPTWEAVTAEVTRQRTAQLLEQGRLLGLAVANAEVSLAAHETTWFEVAHQLAPASQPSRPPRVIDLSSLWAGPLCSRLLQWAGAEVIKVESRTRPDGARAGTPAFFNFLNSGKRQVQLDLASDGGVSALRELIRSADIIIEGSRPRALRQMGIVAEDLLAEVPGLTWLSISGYGRKAPQDNWVAYGDDAGVAAGLSALLHRQTGQWMVLGDAIADPLTGLHGALAALASWQAGGGQLLSVSMVDTVRHCIACSQSLGEA